MTGGEDEGIEKGGFGPPFLYKAVRLTRRARAAVTLRLTARSYLEIDAAPDRYWQVKMPEPVSVVQSVSGW